MFNCIPVYFMGKIEMEHVLIFLLSIILIAGLWEAFYSFYTYKTYRFPFLRYLAYYIICFNASVFLYQILGYININLLGQNASAMHPVLVAAVNISGLFVQVGLTYTFIQCISGLRGKKLPKGFFQVFFTAVAIFLCCYIIGIINIIRNPDSQWLAITFTILTALMVITINAFLVMLLISGRRIQNVSRKKSVLTFGWLYLTPYVSYFIATLLPQQISKFAASGALFLFNIVPIIWIHGFFSKYYGVMGIIENRLLLNNFAQKHDISKRELEVIELLLQGKSNKEIEDILFISFNTVKNHIYNIYQKLGVNSRGQLMYYILEAKSKTDMISD